MDSEDYLILLLSDSNLPTGSFVASSGFESYIKHGFVSPDSTLNFTRDSLTSYASTALPFVSDTHLIVENFITQDGDLLERTLSDIQLLDEYYETMTLNHVARRASKSQGVALLTLYLKGFSTPNVLCSHMSSRSMRESRLSTLVNEYKLRVRGEESHGHLPICWGVLTAAIGLTLGTVCQFTLFILWTSQ